MLALGFAGCVRADVVDFLMTNADRPMRASEVPVQELYGDEYRLLSADFHCHVLPPDHPSHVTRDVPTTFRIAREEHIDFIGFSPHIWRDSLFDAEERTAFAGSLSQLEQLAGEYSGDVLFDVGFEYTTGEGHAGVFFGDVGSVFRRSGANDAHPERFFQQWSNEGGLIVINHPFLTGSPSMIRDLTANMSFRPWTTRHRVSRDIELINRIAGAVEVHNLMAHHLRDRFVVEMPNTSFETTTRFLDRYSARYEREMNYVAGTDSHGNFLRAVTFVLARDRTVEAVRDAVALGRTCVRDPRACLFQVSVDGGPWQPMGASIHGSFIRTRTLGEEHRLYYDGQVAGDSGAGGQMTVSALPQCAVLRAEVSGGASGPVYVNCASIRRAQVNDAN